MGLHWWITLHCWTLSAQSPPFVFGFWLLFAAMAPTPMKVDPWQHSSIIYVQHVILSCEPVFLGCKFRTLTLNSTPKHLIQIDLEVSQTSPTEYCLMFPFVWLPFSTRSLHRPPTLPSTMCPRSSKLLCHAFFVFHPTTFIMQAMKAAAAKKVAMSKGGLADALVHCQM